MFYEYLPELGNKVKVGNKVQVGNKVTIKWNVWSMEMSLYMVMSQNVMQHLGEGWFPHIDQKTSWETISNAPWHIIHTRVQM